MDYLSLGAWLCGPKDDAGIELTKSTETDVQQASYIMHLSMSMLLPAVLTRVRM